jgi:hypothetical protein
MSPFSPRAFAVFILLLHASTLRAQTSDAGPGDDAILAGLQQIASGQWRPQAKEPAWLSLKRQLQGELSRRSDGPIAVGTRRAAANVELSVSRVVGLGADDISLSVSARPRFDLDEVIPYTVTVFGSADGGGWFRLGEFAGKHECGTKMSKVWPTPMRNGFHHLELKAEFAFLRTGNTPSTESECEFQERGTEASARTSDAIAVEPRSIPGLSFAISPDLFGGPTALANSLEAGLPEIPLQVWLDSVLTPVRVPTPIKESWISDFCRPEETAVATADGWRTIDQLARDKPREVCLAFLVSLSDGRVLELRLRAATVKQDTGEWSVEAPAFVDLSIGADGKVLEVPFLSELANAVQTTPQSYPAKDLSIDAWDIRVEPADAKPGDSINIRATVRNLGGRDAPLTSGMVVIKGCCGEPLVVHNFLVDIPLGGSRVVSYQAVMPRWGWVAVDIMPIAIGLRQGPYGQFREENLENNDAMIEIGMRPPGAAVP